MNNLHRELAPISDAAWSQIEEETSRTLKRYLAARRVVDVQGPGGVALSAVGTGHLRNVEAPGDGILARQREVNALVELRVPFDLDRRQIDDVERGANDSDWQPAKEAARRLSFAEDRAIFDGYAAAGIGGIRQGTSNPVMTLPADVRDYPDAIAQALSQLRLVGVNGPYSVLLSADAYTGLSETSRPRSSGVGAYQAPRGRRDHLGPGDRGRIRTHDPGRRLRALPRPGHIHRLFEPYRRGRPSVPSGDIHVPLAHDRGCSCIVTPRLRSTH